MAESPIEPWSASRDPGACTVHFDRERVEENDAEAD